jgi:co-chaperonin GroES (HSP10)
MLAVSPGDVIMFGRYTDFDDGQLVIIREGDIVGIVS